MSRNLNIILLGWGKMGHVEGQALASLRQELNKENIELHLSVVDRMKERKESARPFADVVFDPVDQALSMLSRQNRMPEILVMALNDVGHYPAFDYLLKNTPTIKAFFSKKPLTETQVEANLLLPFLQDKFVSLNTVINFSSVFDKFDEWKVGRGLDLAKIECFWHKNRTQDTRPTIGIATDIVHPLGVASEKLGQGPLHLLNGKSYRGYLSEKAPDVLYEIDTNWVTEKKVPLSLFSSYGAHTQRRSVIGHYHDKTGNAYVAQFDFDFAPRTDRVIVIKQLSKDKSQECLNHTTTAEDTLTGYPGMKPDRVSAYIGWSMRAYMHPEDKLAQQKISNLQAALQLQAVVEQIHATNPLLKATNKSAANLLAQRASP